MTRLTFAANLDRRTLLKGAGIAAVTQVARLRPA